MITFEATVCRDLAASSRREWLETNGIGGFACATLSGMNRRRYHGLLTAATRPPVGRVLLLSKLEETLVVAGARFDLATNQYPGAIHPRGFERQAGFRLDPWPVFTFAVNGVEIEKHVFMLHGSNTTVVQYRVTGGDPGQVSLEVRPLIAFRDYHATTHENAALDRTLRDERGAVSLEPYRGLPRLYLAHNAAAVARRQDWYRSFIYEAERERGLDCVEDLFCAGCLTFDLGRGEASVIASTELHAVAAAPRYAALERARRAALRAAAPADPFAQDLAVAADQFIARRAGGHTVMAGYPWFTDWGRDTMIALPGLTLPARRFDVARSVLREFARHVDRGMLPNRFPDAGEQPEFNTVDATLWYFEAVRAYVAASGDFDLVSAELYPVLADIVDWHVRGTRYGIRVVDTGLLNAGEPGVQLTWMDAKIGDWVVTPRSGKPVEIQALWFNALRIMEQFAARLGRDPDRRRFDDLATRLRWTFNRVFWNQAAGCLYDVVNGVPDASIRPNQVFAVSLPHSMLTPERARRVVEVVERELLTPYGLRTLDRGNPKYAPRYQGDARSRDSVYHQGTVWPWLLGPFLTAYLKVHGGSAAARKAAAAMLQPLREHLRDAGLGQISEILDAEAPHQPRGCFAQAWSVAEILRVAADLAESNRTAKPARRAVAARS